MILIVLEDAIVMLGFTKARALKIRALSRQPHHFYYEQVLGTTLEIIVSAGKKDAEKARDLVLSEIDRLESIYSRYKLNSELNRFLSAPVGKPFRVSPDLYYLLEQSLEWIQKTQGAFNPATELYSEIWKQAVLTQHLPETSPGLFSNDVYKLEEGKAIRLVDVPLNFNAIAKGLIVDRAIEAASRWVSEISISIGGDLRHSGQRPIRVALEDKPVDNLKGKTVLKIKNQAVATSGLSRRGFDIAGTHYSHIIDPRNAQSVQHTVSVTVIAPECMTADVLATAFSVLGVEASLSLADQLEVACILNDANGSYSNSLFRQMMKG